MSLVSAGHSSTLSANGKKASETSTAPSRRSLAINGDTNEATRLVWPGANTKCHVVVEFAIIRFDFTYPIAFKQTQELSLLSQLVGAWSPLASQLGSLWPRLDFWTRRYQQHLWRYCLYLTSILSIKWQGEDTQVFLLLVKWLALHLYSSVQWWFQGKTVCIFSAVIHLTVIGHNSTKDRHRVRLISVIQAVSMSSTWPDTAWSSCVSSATTTD